MGSVITKGTISLILLLVMFIAIAILIVMPSSGAAQLQDVTDIKISPAIFSPDGDGSADEAEIIVLAGTDQNIVVNLYDLGGKRVLQDLWVDQIDPGVYWGTWNGSTHAGTPLPDGVYEIRCAPPQSPGDEAPGYNASVRVHTAPLLLELFTEKGDPIPNEDQVVRDDVHVHLMTNLSAGDPDFEKATLDLFEDNRWIPVASDSDGSDGWSIPFPIAGVADGSHILRGTLLDLNGSRLGNLTTMMIERPKSPVPPRIQLSDIVLRTDGADAPYPPLKVRIEVTNSERHPVSLTIVFSTDLYQLETVFLTLNASESRILDANWGRDSEVSTITVIAYFDGLEVARSTERVDVDDGTGEPEDQETVLTEDDLPLVLAGTAIAGMVVSGASFGLGLKRCVKLGIRPMSPKRRKKELKKQEKEQKRIETEERKLRGTIPGQTKEARGQAIQEQPSGPPGRTQSDHTILENPPVMRYGMLCLGQHLQLSSQLDGKGDDILPGSVSSQPTPTLHAEYAIACQQSVEASNALRSIGIERVSNMGSVEPTLHMKYGIACNQALSGLGPDSGITGVRGPDGQEPFMSVKYGLACRAATSGLNALDGKGDNGMISPRNAVQNLAGMENGEISPRETISSNQPSVNSDNLKFYETDVYFGESNYPKSGSGDMPSPGPGDQQPEQDIPVMFNPEEIDIKKSVPWTSGYGEGKGDASTPNLEFTEGDPHMGGRHGRRDTGSFQLPGTAVRLVCQNCGRIAAPGFHNCGFCGGPVIRAPAPGSRDSQATADNAYTPNRRPHEHIGTSDDDDDDGTRTGGNGGTDS